MKKLSYVIVCFIIILTTLGCQNKSGFLTSTEWSLYDTNYAFAVEDSNYDGDVLEAGVYTFELIGGTDGKGALFDIYIENDNYSSLSELKEIDYTIGGNHEIQIKQEVTLNAGEYVYIVPYQNLVYEPTGYLSITKMKDN